MKLKDLKFKKSGLEKEAQALVNTAKAEDRDITAEEADTINSLLDEASTLKADIETKQRAIDAVNSLPQDVAPTARKIVENLGADVVVGKALWENDPCKGFKSDADFLLQVMDFGRNNGRRGKRGRDAG